jgi:hypothetical protein
MGVLTLCAVLVMANVLVDVETMDMTNDFAVPFEIDPSNGQSKFGDTRRDDVDDEVAQVTFSQAFPFGDTSFTKFFISPNGLVTANTRASHQTYTSLTDPWSDVPSRTVLFYLQDVKLEANCTSDNTKADAVGCGVYHRTGVDSETTDAIKKVIRNANLHPGADSKAAREFNPDPARTLVVTWYRVVPLNAESVPGGAYDNPLPINSFQGILTTDGTHSYAIFSYKELNYPKKFSGTHIKAGVVFDNVKHCQLPVDSPSAKPNNLKRDELTCLSNSNGYQGVYVVGLTSNSAQACPSLKTGATGATDYFIPATCSDCNSVALNNDVRETCPNTPDASICGTNDVIYNTWCQLRKDACGNRNVTLFEEKACYRSPCLKDNGGCSDKCTVSASNTSIAECSCGDGRKLRDDGKTCNYEGYFYMAIGENGFVMGKNFANMTVEVPTADKQAADKKAVLAMAHDFNSNTMFYAYFNNSARVSIVIAFRPPYKYQYVRWVPGQVDKMIYDGQASKLIVRSTPKPVPG